MWASRNLVSDLQWALFYQWLGASLRGFHINSAINRFPAFSLCLPLGIAL